MVSDAPAEQCRVIAEEPRVDDDRGGGRFIEKATSGDPDGITHEQTVNDDRWFGCKTRSQALDFYEEPDLEKLRTKILGAN